MIVGPSVAEAAPDRGGAQFAPPPSAAPRRKHRATLWGFGLSDTPGSAGTPLGRRNFRQQRFGNAAPAGLGAATLRPRLAVLLLLFFGVSLLRAAESSELAPLAARSLLLDVAHAGNRLVAVGDHGHVLLSNDDGRTWRQVIVPTRAMLTAVAFGDTTHGWAVGHDGVILTTADAGVTWSRQDHGDDLETIFLDVAAGEAGKVLAVGAYGKVRASRDGGQTWQPDSITGDEIHLNQLNAGVDGTFYVAAESGTLLTYSSKDPKWRKRPLPYEGSLFGVLPLGDRSVLAYGLRGHVFASSDGGDTWTERDLSVPVLIMSGVRLKSGVIVLGGAAGNFFLSKDGGRTFAHWQPVDYRGGAAALLETADGALLVAGENGVARLQLPIK